MSLKITLPAFVLFLACVVACSDSNSSFREDDAKAPKTPDSQDANGPQPAVDEVQDTASDAAPPAETGTEVSAPAVAVPEAPPPGPPEETVAAEPVSIGGTFLSCHLIAAESRSDGTAGCEQLSEAGGRPVALEANQRMAVIYESDLRKLQNLLEEAAAFPESSPDAGATANLSYDLRGDSSRSQPSDETLQRGFKTALQLSFAEPAEALPKGGVGAALRSVLTELLDRLDSRFTLVPDKPSSMEFAVQLDKGDFAFVVVYPSRKALSAYRAGLLDALDPPHDEDR